MRTIKWHVETGLQGAEWSGEIDVDDNATDAEIDADVREEIANIITWTWWEEEDESTVIPKEKT